MPTVGGATGTGADGGEGGSSGTVGGVVGAGAGAGAGPGATHCRWEEDGGTEVTELTDAFRTGQQLRAVEQAHQSRQNGCNVRLVGRT